MNGHESALTSAAIGVRSVDVHRDSAVSSGRSCSSSLEGRIVPVDALEIATRDAMYALLAHHFSGTDRPTFDSDLAGKSCAILLEDGHGQLRGFSTLLLYRTVIDEVLLSIVYSGDTIVDCAWWGSPALPRTWIRAVRDLAAATPNDPLFWFLLTSGYRTYRFLPVFFRSFYPRHDTDDPRAATLLDTIAGRQFGDRYDRTSGIVRLARPQVLTSDLLALPQARALDPHVAFFLARNPGYVRGDELACLARISDENLTPAGRRMARSERS